MFALHSHYLLLNKLLHEVHSKTWLLTHGFAGLCGDWEKKEALCTLTYNPRLNKRVSVLQSCVSYLYPQQYTNVKAEWTKERSRPTTNPSQPGLPVRGNKLHLMEVALSCGMTNGIKTTLSFQGYMKMSVAK